VRSVGVVEKLKTRRASRSSSRRFAKPHDFAETYFDRKKLHVAVYRREGLQGGARLRVPGIVTGYSATTLVPQEANARVDRIGNIVVEIGG